MGFSASLSTFSGARPPGVVEEPTPAASLAAHGKGSQLGALALDGRLEPPRFPQDELGVAG